MRPDIKYLGIPNICFSLTDKDDPREEKFIQQRLKRGFDDSETWSLRDTIVNFTLQRLELFKKLTIGFPASLNSMEEWHQILDKIIFSFKLVQLDDEEDGIRNRYNEYEEGMQLFSKWFLHLCW